MVKNNVRPKSYWVEYSCINCQQKMSLEVKFGKSIPIFSTGVSKMNEDYGFLEAPECVYCGCKLWSHGKYIQ